MCCGMWLPGLAVVRPYHGDMHDGRGLVHASTSIDLAPGWNMPQELWLALSCSVGKLRLRRSSWHQIEQQ